MAAGEAREWPMARYLNGISQEKRESERERPLPLDDGWTDADAIWP